ncbi:MAG: YlzJ-like family protein [Herbinix sp.]|nr:YlzJ-like family protein [Herbinix sp.]
MLYTVRPLERIYAVPPEYNNKKSNKTKDQEEEAEYRDVLLPNGRIVTRREGENYVIERINSTDMNDYLNEKYIPGKNMKV